MTVFSIPNIITLGRIIIIPIFVTTVVYKRHDYALALFAIAAVSDTLDGLLARISRQKTALGAFLDPLADKCLLITSFVLFSAYGWIPKWLTITVISRDIIVILGWFLLYLTTHKTKVEPSATGKAAIASQLIIIAYTLLAINIPNIPPVHDVMLYAVAILTITSGVQYIYRGLKNANEKQLRH